MRRSLPLGRFLVFGAIAMLAPGCGRTDPPTPKDTPLVPDPNLKSLFAESLDSKDRSAELKTIARKYGAVFERGIPRGLPRPTTVPCTELWLQEPGPTDEQVSALAAELAATNERVSVNFVNCSRVSPEGIAKLKPLPNVVGLGIGRATDLRVLTLLEGMKQLESLMVLNDAVTDADLAPIAKLISLKELNVHSEKVTPAAFAHLATLSELRQFRFRAGIIAEKDWKFTDEGISHLKALSKLEVFDAGNVSGLTAKSLAVIAGWPELAELTLKCEKGTDLEKLAPLKKLKILELHAYEDQRNAALQNVARLTSLEELRCDFPVTDASLGQLAGLVNLRRLTMELGVSSYVTDAGVAHLKGMPRLQVLTVLRGSRVTDAGMAHLKSLRELKELGLLSTKVTDAGVGLLRELPELELLDLRYTPVTDKAAEALRQFPKLKRLWVNGTKMTQPVIESLRKEKGLEISY